MLFLQLPIPNNMAGRTIENAGHGPMFALITIGCLIVLRKDFSIHGRRLYVIAGLLCAGAGFMSEVIQRPLRRDASWDDVLADVVGVIAGLALFAVFDRESGLRRAARAAAFAVAVAGIGLSVAPVVRMGVAYWHRNHQFPVVADFSSRTDLFWVVGYGARREIVSDALEISFDSQQFPGVSFHEPVPDWRAFRELVVDVENPTEERLLMGVRVHDRQHSRAFHDRFNRRFELAAGERRSLRIALADVRAAPRGRSMDMGHISDVTLYLTGRSGARRLRVYSLHLE